MIESGPKLSFLCMLDAVLVVLGGCTVVEDSGGRSTFQHSVCFKPNTFPDGADVSDMSLSEMKPNYAYMLGGEFWHKVTQEDVQRGKVVLPALYFRREGYREFKYPSSEIVLDEAFWRAGPKHYYTNSERVALQKDPGFWGSKSKPNKVYVTINSEPGGARIYENGKLIGTTPYTGTYDLTEDNYRAGRLNCTPLTTYKEGYLQQEKQLEFEIDPGLRYSLGEKIERAAVFFLRPDPDYRGQTSVAISRPSNVNADYDAAKEEYEQALTGYNLALEKLEKARLMGDINEMSAPGLLGSPSRTDRLVGLLNTLATPAAVKDAEREVEIARERLERAKARLNNAEWK